MGEIVTIAKSLKESSSYVAMSAGAGMTQTSINAVQLFGVVIGVGGLKVAVLRWQEARRAVLETKRANDLNQEKWEYERNAKGKNDKKTD